VQDPQDSFYDVVVLGTGGAGLVAALAAAESGATVGIFDKAETVGGTTAISGGTVWIANNNQMAERGLSDSRDEARAYLQSLSLGLIENEFIDLIVDEGPDLVRWLESVSALRFDALVGFPDYHPEKPGGKLGGGRSLDPALFSFAELGAWAARVARSARNPHVRLTDTPLGGGTGFLAEDVAAERASQDLRGCGNGLVGPLLKALLDRGIEPQLQRRAEDLLVEDGRVSGVELAGGQGVRAQCGVILATGGFEWAPDLVRQFLRGPMTSPASLPHNSGDGLLMLMRAGASLGNMSEAWWVPTLQAPGDVAFGHQRAHLVLRERTLPRSIMVNSDGRRFANEASNYNAFAGALHQLDPTRFDYVNLPCWLIFDQGFLDEYGFHTAAAGDPAPDWVTGSDSISGLAELIGTPPAALEATISRWNALVAAGDDADFGRGRSAYDRWSGDPRHRGTVESTLGSLDQPPYYAVQIHSGCLGTKGGARTDIDGHVLDTHNRPISGLYAAGNAAAAPTGRAYAGAGGTLGPILILARRAGRHAANRGQ
jgi:succinate dehydrogenase/fumarate reductase flavoprotein subunit